MESKKSKEDQ